jgi:chromatin segregation and condensation protein Rec8/ScpA/Scc1 (kleisin family)
LAYPQPLSNASASEMASFTQLPKLEEGAELLVVWAKEGKLDPWNVDLTAVTELYLNAVADEVEQNINTLKQAGGNAFGEASKNKESLRLRRSGKTLWALSILLRMKSELLAGLDPFLKAGGLEDANWDDLLEYDEQGEVIDREALAVRQQEAVQRLGAHLRARFGSLEAVLQRRRSSKQLRVRPVTLNDLLEELKRVELEQRRRTHFKDFSRLTTEEITSELAHDEFEESAVQAVLAVIEEHLPRTETQAEQRLALESLVEWTGRAKVVVFLALLFLEARGAIETWQPCFYSKELWVSWPRYQETEVKA